jgi:hypothetical protein
VINHFAAMRKSMIRKSGHRFSDKIMLNQELERERAPEIS